MRREGILQKVQTLSDKELRRLEDRVGKSLIKLKFARRQLDEIEALQAEIRELLNGSVSRIP